DVNNGLAVSDPVDGRFVIIRTTDGGKTWNPIAPENMAAALEGEGAFAASGTCLIAQGKTNAWFATGGAKIARVFRSADKGQTWFAASTPIKTGNAASGIFSIAFKDARIGMAVGGDYQKEKEASEHIAITHDGGRNWVLVKNSGLTAFRSAVTWIGDSTMVAVGPSGTDFSPNDGAGWKATGDVGYHAFSFARRGSTGWAVGEKGRIAKFTQATQATQATKR
ncbi:MAG: WD40/YVTN/BNR-like repeat-containing protein, partial [Blastocatellia bacterium]